ncbi:SDR family NAD(P)-dependent oxidoreductase [Sulfoacidibacillus thermotolerans]|uniref:Short-chain dehydrogenase n=1 Tax=Sulfoacidibacillus thermotolerans TaxID=1765684 RepID=A0A2U3D7H5_SULT2|nr:SDR family oxidoreductase [Sulfoacidibacillus thermotolerans]PWI57211.1 short-chain dehydrogenase [Sulfoacidibacillus thermotolerans]
MSSLMGKVALVTGGGRGIGAATSKLLAERGARVVVNYVGNQASAEQVVAEIVQKGGEALAVQADVRDVGQVEQMVGVAVKKWGTIDLLVNNANMSFAMKPIADMTWDEFAQKLNDEMKSAFYLTQSVTRVMVRQHYGRIVYIASGLARRPGPRMAAHGTAKAALVQFARFVAQEYGPMGITANVISPGLVQTDATRFQPEEYLKHTAEVTPLGHVATPEDIAHAIAMYVSDDTQFITGVYVPVNGGLSMD